MKVLRIFYNLTRKTSRRVGGIIKLGGRKGIILLLYDSGVPKYVMGLDGKRGQKWENAVKEKFDNGWKIPNKKEMTEIDKAINKQVLDKAVQKYYGQGCWLNSHPRNSSKSAYLWHIRTGISDVPLTILRKPSTVPFLIQEDNI